MVSVLAVQQPVQAQPTVQQCWEDVTTPPSGAVDHAADTLEIQGGHVCITGTRTDDQGAQQIYTRWVNLDGSGCPGNPTGIEEHFWPHPVEDGESVAKRLATSRDGSFFDKPITWVGGRKTKDQDPNEWSAVVIPYHFHGGGWQATSQAQVFTFGENASGNHEVVAMDGIGHSTDHAAGLAVAAIRSGSAFSQGATSTLVVLRGQWRGGWPELEVDVIMTQDVDFEIRDVKIEQRWVGSQDYIRIWAVGHKMGIPISGRVYGIDLNDDEVSHAFTVSSMHTTPARFVLGPGENGEPDLFITGSVEPAFLGPTPNYSEMFVSRFGMIGTTHGFRWHETFDSEGHAYGLDVGVDQGQLDSNGTTPPSEIVYVAGVSQRQIATNPDVFTNDFTVWCITQAPQFGQVELRWDALLREDDGDDRAFRLLVGYDMRAIVTGVEENQSGDWDWVTAEYTHDKPLPNQEKEPEWQIAFPLNYPSSGNDAPVAITSPDVQFPFNFWVGGTSVDSQGERMTIVRYHQN